MRIMRFSYELTAFTQNSCTVMLKTLSKWCKRKNADFEFSALTFATVIGWRPCAIKRESGGNPELSP